MKFYLKYKNESVMEFAGLITGSEILIEPNSFIIINENLLPIFLKNIDNDEEFYKRCCSWIKNRKTISLGDNIQEKMLYKLYNTAPNMHLMGDTFGLSILRNAVSWFDNYYIDPEKTSSVYFGDILPDIKSLFFIKKMKTLDKKHPETIVDDFLSGETISDNSIIRTNSFALSIPSDHISFWKEKDGKIYLYQVVSAGDINFKKAVEILKKSNYLINISEEDIGNDNKAYNCDKKKFYRFDFTEFVGMDVLWLSDLLLLFDKKYKTWKDFIYHKYPELKKASNAFDFIEKVVDEEFYENKVPIRLKGIGVGILNDKYFPIIIL